VGILEAALAEFVRAGECARLVAEHLVVEQILVEGRTIHGHEGFALARAVGVQSFGGEFLAGAVAP
jgi:hypothetical protein